MNYKKRKKIHYLKKFLEQFKDFSIIVLIIAAIVSGVVGVAQGEGFTDTIIILIVVILNAVIGVAQESKAEKSLEALKKLSESCIKSNKKWKRTSNTSKRISTRRSCYNRNRRLYSSRLKNNRSSKFKITRSIT